MYTKHSIRGMFIVLGIGLAVGIWGCNQEKTNAPTYGSIVAVSPDEIPNLTSTNMTIPMTDSIAMTHVEIVSKRTTVSSLISSFQQAGYAFDISNSFVQEGMIPVEDSTDLHLARMTVLALKYLPDTANIVTYLFYVESEFPTFVLPVTCAFNNQPDTGNFVMAGENLWMCGYELVPDLAVAHNVLPSATDASSWLGCWLGGTVGGCISSSVACTAATIGYAHCLALGCGGSALGFAVGCAIRSWLG